MCLAAWAIGQHARFPFVLLANRDERFDRPAAPMAWWADASDRGVLAGRDLSAGGTWLGLSAAGRLALVTNVREPGRTLPVSPSRGELVPAWLRGAHDPLDAKALTRLAAPPRNGFNLLVADLRASVLPGGTVAHWLSNRPDVQQLALGPGVHAVSNAALDTPWPKLLQLKQRLQRLLADATGVQPVQAASLQALADAQVADDARLPATGVPLLRERQLSAAFIRIVGDDPATAVYGTRCSTVVLVEQTGDRRRVHVLERSFGAAGVPTGDVHHAWWLAAT